MIEETGHRLKELATLLADDGAASTLNTEQRSPLKPQRPTGFVETHAGDVGVIKRSWRDGRG